MSLLLVSFAGLLMVQIPRDKCTIAPSISTEYRVTLYPGLQVRFL
jgi:hypothetical protein